MPTWQELLNGIIVFDGAMGTMLQASGLDLGRCPELWNLDNQETIQGIHRAYVEAGAMIVGTNSFGGNSIKLKEYGLADKTLEINKRAAELAKEAVDGKALVAGSVGPTGLLIEPYGPATFDDLYQAFALQVEGLAQGGADLIIIETMSDLEEMRAAVIAAKGRCSLPVICSMTFDKSGRTMMGVSPEQAAYVLDALGADAVGANCSTGPEELLKVLERMAMVTELPLIVEPNAGLPVIKEGKVLYEETPAIMAEFARKFVAAGVQIIGGCCGTTPHHIQAVAKAVKNLKPLPRKVAPKIVLAGKRQLVIAEDASGVDVGKSRMGLDALELKGSSIDQQVKLILKDATAQIEAGAQVIEVNVLSAGKESPAVIRRAVLEVQSIYDVPIAIHAGNHEVVEAGLKAVKGRALLTGITGMEPHLEELLGLAKKYGAAVWTI